MTLLLNTVFLEGLFLGMGLFAAPGPKDTLVIRQGVSAGPIWGVVGICILADIVLIALGVSGLGALLGSRPGLVAMLRNGGALYLVFFGGQRLLACIRDQSSPDVSGNAATHGLLRNAFMLGFANPYAWLDTVVLIGSIGAAKPGDQQSYFSMGAMAASLVWFVLLALGCQRLAFLFKSRMVWRVLDACVAILMFYLALTLAK
ncbi:LysE family transporter [Pseudomonas sp. RIT-To-2]|uniref:LysE family transporter n=1 Tax=Pseudomonas sp. RIT-To-2 TaxID=3462541 RepID=UPI002412F9D8